MDLSVLLPRAGVRGKAEHAQLVSALDSTGLEWEIVVVGATGSSLSRVRAVPNSPSESTFRNGHLASRGQRIVALESSSEALIEQLPGVVAELFQSNGPDLVLSTSSPETRGRAEKPARIRDRLARIASRRRDGVAPSGIYGFRREVLERVGVDERIDHPLGLFARAYESGLEIRKLHHPRGCEVVPSALSRRFGFLLQHRPALYYGSFGLCALAIGAIGVSVDGIRWAFHPDGTDWGSTLSLAVIGMAGAQIALFSYLFDRQQGLALVRDRGTPRRA